MRKLLRLSLLLFSALLAQQLLGQSGAVIPQGGAGHADKASCVLLKRMGPADQVTSRLYSFGIRGKQFQYIEGKLPEGFPFHGRLTDHDVRNLQGRGAEVIVLSQNYTADELKQARTDCQGITGNTPLQDNGKTHATDAAARTTPDAKLVPAGATTTVAPGPPPAAPQPAQLQVSSTPDGADIEIDGGFVGNTPSSVGLAAGQHQVSVKKTGFKPWERKITVSSGQVNLNAVLEAEAK
jgi:PEGA domain